jgi:hypothetical protein
LSYSAREAGAAKKRSPAQLVALVFGVAYLAVALLGFILEERGLLLDTFGINGLHNIVHLAIGIALLASSTSAVAARTTSMVVGVTYLLVTVLGFVAKDAMDDLLNINTADNFLHLVSGAILTLAALAPSRRRTHARAEPATR